MCATLKQVRSTIGSLPLCHSVCNRHRCITNCVLYMYCCGTNWKLIQFSPKSTLMEVADQLTEQVKLKKQPGMSYTAAIFHRSSHRFQPVTNGLHGDFNKMPIITLWWIGTLTTFDLIVTRNLCAYSDELQGTGTSLQLITNKSIMRGPCPDIWHKRNLQ